MNKGFELWQAGTKSFKAKDFEAAEDHLLAAYQCYATDDKEFPANTMVTRWGICCTLAKVYRSAGRYEDAINILEKTVPFHAAFYDLASIYRFLGKAAKKDGDLQSHAEYYRKMFCLAKLSSQVTAMRLPNPPIVDWQRAAKWLSELRRKHSTIYCYQWDGNRIADSAILSAADYKILEGL
jgi:tetratricopeptide (TPR) repeat protein